MTKHEQVYHIDGVPATAWDIIDKATDYGYTDDILQSSVAADILRKHGHFVGRIEELSQPEEPKP
jgi:hypothetical protein